MNKILFTRTLTIIIVLVISAFTTSVNAQEAYAVYTDGNHTLTFYYDNMLASRDGTKYTELDWIATWNGFYSSENEVRIVVFDPSFANVRPTSTNSWFEDMKHLTSFVGLQYLNTSEVTDMRDMFSGCSALTSLDLSTFDTSKVKFMIRMFENCSSLTNLNLSSFRNPNVEYMGRMFRDCTSLKKLDLSNFGTTKVTDMPLMFRGCTALESLDLRSFDTSNVTDMSSMFSNCSALTNLDVSSFNTSNVIDMNNMFSYCSSIKELDLKSFNTSNVTNMGYMFEHCSSLTNLNLSSFNTSKVTDMHEMFAYCSSFVTIDLSSFNTENVLTMGYMFHRCEKLKSLNLSNFRGSFENSGGIFDGCKRLKELFLSIDFENIGGSSCSNVGKKTFPCLIHVPDGFKFGVDTSEDIFIWKEGYFTLIPGEPREDGEPYVIYENNTLTFYFDFLESSRSGKKYDDFDDYGDNWTPRWNGYYASENEVTKVVFDPSFANERPTSTDSWFKDLAHLTSIIGLEYLNTSYVISMHSMFENCSSLTEVDLSTFNTVNVVDMSYMFTNCKTLSNINLSNINTSNVTNIRDMFSNCSSLTTLDLSSFNTSNVTEMFYMFDGCSALKSLDLSKFNMSKVTSLENLCKGCSSLLSINFGNNKMSNVTSLRSMFQGCSSLQKIDLSHFDTSKVTDVHSMFYGCENLKRLDVSSFKGSFADNSYGLFYDCIKLELLSLSSAFENIYESAFYFVGTPEKPCVLHVPDGFNFGVDTSGSYFQWKEGYFKLPKYYTFTVKTTNGSVYYMENPDDWDSYIEIDGQKEFSVLEGSDFTLSYEPGSVVKILRNGVDMTDEYHPNYIEPFDVDGLMIATKEMIISEIMENTTIEIIFAEGETVQNGIDYLLYQDEAYVAYSRYDAIHPGAAAPYGWFSNYKDSDVSIPSTISHNGKNYTVTEIMEQAFVGWSNTENVGNSYLRNLILPPTLKKIRKEAFRGCDNLQYVEIQSTALAKIDEGAFSNCKNIKYVRIRTKTPPTLGANAFTHQQNTTLFVPTKCKSAYSAADGWKDFSKITETDRTYQLTITAEGNGQVKWYNDVVKGESKTVTVYGGSYGTLQLTPDSHCKVERLVINGVDVSPSSNQLEYIIQNTTVEVVFSHKPFGSLTVQVIGNGSVKVEKLAVTPEGFVDPYAEREKVTEVGANSKDIVELEDGTSLFLIYDKDFAKVYENGINVSNQFIVNPDEDGEYYDDEDGHNYTVNGDTELIFMYAAGSGSFTHEGVTYSYVNNKDDVKVLYADCKGHLKIPEPYSGNFGYRVVEVADHAFCSCPELYAVTLPSSVTAIGKDLFIASDNIAALEVNANVNIYDYTLGDISNPNFLLYVPAKSYNKTTSIQNVVANLKADEIVLTDTETGNNFYCPKIFTASKISYTHFYQMKSGIDGKSQGWETITLPFDVKNIKHSTKGDLTPFAKYNSTTSLKPFWLYELSSDGWKKAGEIKANTPYIISMPNNSIYDNEYNLGGEVTFSATNATVRNSGDLISAVYNNRTFFPTFQQKAKDGINALNVYNQYITDISNDTYDEGSTFVHELRDVHPFEAYIINSNGSNTDFIIFEDMPTDLPQLPIVSTFQPTTYRVVNLSGQLVREVFAASPSEAVANLPAGIYIVNGRKTVVGY